MKDVCECTKVKHVYRLALLVCCCLWAEENPHLLRIFLVWKLFNAETMKENKEILAALLTFANGSKWPSAMNSPDPFRDRNSKNITWPNDAAKSSRSVSALFSGTSSVTKQTVPGSCLVHRTSYGLGALGPLGPLGPFHENEKWKIRMNICIYFNEQCHISFNGVTLTKSWQNYFVTFIQNLLLAVPPTSWL